MSCATDSPPKDLRIGFWFQIRFFFFAKIVVFPIMKFSFGDESISADLKKYSTGQRCEKKGTSYKRFANTKGVTIFLFFSSKINIVFYLSLLGGG